MKPKVKPYLKLELDARKEMPRVGRRCKISPGDALWGLTELWEYCWSHKVAVVTEGIIYGCCSADGYIEALVDFGFLEPVDNDFRVRGAEEHLRVAEGRSRGGHAAKSNLLRGASRDVSRAAAGSQPGKEDTKTPISPGSTQQPNNPTTQTPKEEEAPAAVSERLPIALVAPDNPPEAWTGDEFWRWAQCRRQAAGFIAETKRPRDLGPWWSACLMTPGVNAKRMKEAFYAFGASEHWAKALPPFPFRAFASQWSQFIPRGVPHAAA